MRELVGAKRNEQRGFFVGDGAEGAPLAGLGKDLLNHIIAKASGLKAGLLVFSRLPEIRGSG